jgi:hypothetical protein
MKSRLLIVAIAIAVSCFAACNYTDGACWPVGQTNGNAGVGTGTVVQSGAGGSLGDGPSQGTSGPACNSTPSNSDTDTTPSSPDAGGDPASTWIYCKDPDPVACLMQCAEIGIYCSGFRPHPNSPSVGLGRLTGCKDGTPTSVCSYVYPNTDVCNFFSAFGYPISSLCVYPGGK